MMTESDDEELYEEGLEDAPRHLSDSVVRNPIRELAFNAPLSVPSDALVSFAVQAMVGAGVGCCVMTQADGSVVGILSERDILTKIVARRLDPAETRVDQVMTPNPVTLTPEDSIGFAVNQMAVGGYRHIPIVDDRRRPLGILSVRNVVRYLAEFFPTDVLNLPPSPDAAIGRDREGA